MSPSAAARAHFVDLHPPQDDFRASVLDSLARRELSPKWFYDARGSALFDQICATPEYYVTRTELALLRQVAPEIGQRVGPRATVIEYGTGSAEKVKRLLEGLPQPHAYVAVDISGEHLRTAADALQGDYPDVCIVAICADFTQPFTLPADLERAAPRQGDAGLGQRLGFFPGSTIGNFLPAEAEAFLVRAREQLGPRGALVIGVDLKKDVARLNAAYNDAQGVTAAFNLNVLHRIRAELGAELDPADFEHLAFYNEAQSRVEMHLRARRDTRIRLGPQRFTFARGETLHTENSHKYSVEDFTELAGRAGFRSDALWTDPERLFSIHYLVPA